MAKRRRKPTRDSRVIERPRAKYIEYEVIIPRSHTEVHLNKKGRRCLHALSPEDDRELGLDLTLGGGYDGRRGVLYIVHDRHYPVHTLWRKIHQLFNKYEKRGKC